MRIVFKILLFPFALLLSIIAPLLLFLFSTVKVVLNFLSGIALIIAIAAFIMKHIAIGITFIVMAFLLSPIGIPLFSEWLIEKLYDLKDAMWDFIKG